MNDLSGVEQAFANLASAPTHVQALLRPVLIRATQDPALMRVLEPRAFPNHVGLLGALLLELTTEGVGAQLPPRQTFINLTIGENVEDAEEAYDFARTLDSPLRERVEGGLSRALRFLAAHPAHETVSLLALSRLLGIALNDLPFVAHVLGGREVEEFLPTTHTVPPKQNLHAKLARKAPGRATGVLAPHLQRFVGALVEITAAVSDQSAGRAFGRLFVMIGRVEEISTTYIIVRSLPAHRGDQEGEPVLVGLAHVISMRTLSASLQ